MRIVYCGELWNGGTCRMRLEALERLGHTVEGVDTTWRFTGAGGLALRVLRKTGWAPDPAGASPALLEVIARRKPDLVWIDKGLCISPQTLKQIRARNITLIHYSPDCMTNRRNQSWQFLKSVPLYDLHVTTKSYNVAERQAMGAREVVFLNNAYCPKIHRPVPLTADERRQYGGGVGFIGAFEEERAAAIWFLVTNGIRIRVWGEGWSTWAKRHRHPLLTVEGSCIWGEEYVKATCSFDVNLGFLRKVNRDMQTTRSVEIPACGAFLLAERTDEHQQLFREGAEAEFFATREELLEKCRFYLAHPEERAKIAAAGYRRCLDSDYSYTAHMSAALRHVEVARDRSNSNFA
ncbi:MAG TPA: glycosyltransferase [Bryobacteraceae bacterium]|jgi:spore maturation protein CgeB|nr:glycosyltransferase [Bryobacteraceae bacterium]